MISAIHRIYHMDSQDLAGPIFTIFLPLPLFSGITGVDKVVVKLALRSEPLHLLTIGAKVL
jgi:hypothetical protein